MAGWLTAGAPNVVSVTGAEQLPLDTEIANGVAPQSASATLQQLALMTDYLRVSSSKTMVSGTRYYSSITIGTASTLTGISVKIGGTGGTDSWIFELHNAAGALVATTATAGTTAGTANQWQQIAFTATYAAAAGTYFVAVQSNGTTATLATLSSPTNTTLTGSATGTFGTGASITPPTTYTTSLGPLALVY